MKNVKVGIITHYYNSSNYGGLLQAFALQKALEKREIDSSQIQYDSSKKKRTLFGAFLHFGNRFLTELRYLIHQRKRIKSCKTFRLSIPHTVDVFNYKTINKASQLFDAFITGSDQVWNPSEINIGYALDFTTKPKFSYAASIALASLSKKQLEEYNCFLSDYMMISVREKNSVDLLKCEKKVEHVLDPVFLLSESDWCAICSERLTKEKYIFCYFLGDDIFARKYINEISQKNGWRVFVIPFLNNKKNYYKTDLISDNVSPNDFISLIKNAECVMTDSFHAVCFSYIFKKDFYVFSRKNGEHMGERLKDLLHTINCEERFVTNKLNYLSIDYDKIDKSVFDDMKKKSVSFFEEMVRRIKNNDQ